MATIIHRVGLPSNLSPVQVDANFDGLNEDVAALQGQIDAATVAAAAAAAAADAAADAAATAADDAAARQAALVSGTNIKTINGVSLLGSGNVDTGANVYQLLTDGATVPWDYTLGGFAAVTIAGDRDLTISGISGPAAGVLKVIQGTGGFHKLTLPGELATPFQWSTTQGDYDYATFLTLDGIGFSWTLGTFGTTMPTAARIGLWHNGSKELTAGSGYWREASGNGRDFTLTGVTDLGANGIQFNGNSSTSAISPVLMFPRGFTMYAKVLWSALDTELFGMNGASNGFMIYNGSSDIESAPQGAGTFGSGGVQIATSASYAVVAYVWDSNAPTTDNYARAYLNGSLVAIFNGGALVAGGGYVINIHGEAGGGFNFDGKLKAFAFYDIPHGVGDIVKLSNLMALL